MSSVWHKIGPCPPDCDKKDLPHTIVDSQEKVWVSFKYENLPIFCFGCGRLGHGVKECQVLSSVEKERSDGDFPYSIELKAESNLVGKESLLFEFFTKESMKQYQYKGGVEMGIGSEVNDGGKDVVA
ncbi:hypothetical protein Goari_010519 [Gossypium aridum]|uniref:CCHC-type domain-containing protein n=1 Tax=Gossypium aridum TaxID=34290 RepID=A0A7J8Y0M3_GOSAI|nr:hypothetical protein [Gossypium aridum]